MRYLLVLGLFCNVYRKKPRIRLFFNNQLVDEFNMPHQPKNKNLIHPRINLKHLLQPLTHKMQIEYAEKSLPPLLFYHIDVDNQITQTQIRIDIDNNDSNYINGFITNSTLLQIKVLSLLPQNKKIYEWFLQKHTSRRNTDRYAWYRRKLINRFFKFDQAKWIGNNGQKINCNNDMSIEEYSIGGSGSLTCELKKKYGILLAKNQIIKRSYIFGQDLHLHDAIYYKYEQYANQRNSN
jgi:hypothetical protein